MQQVVDAGRARLARDPGPGRRVGHGPRACRADIEDVLQRSLEDVREAPRRPRRLVPGLVPNVRAAPSSRAAAAAGERWHRIFSGSGIPDLGGMMSALGTIGNSPASSGSWAAAAASGRRLRRWRGRRRRRLLGGGAAARSRALGPDVSAPNSSRHAVEPLDRDRRPRPRAPHRRRSSGMLASRARRRPAPELPMPVVLVAERAGHPVRRTRCRGTPRSRRPGRPGRRTRTPRTRRAHLLAVALALERPGPSHDPVRDRAQGRRTSRPTTRLRPDGRAVELDEQVEAPVVGRPCRRVRPSGAARSRARTAGSGRSTTRAERHLVGRVDAGPRDADEGRQVVVVGQAQDEALAPDPQREERPGVARGAIRAASMGGRRYTPPMGAVETMEDFFEKLNGGDREGAVALMDEKTEMRVHVGDSVQTLRGVERVGGWFLRGDAGLRMIPGGIRDTGQHLRGGPAGRPAGRPDPAHRRHVPRGGGPDHGDQHRAPVARRGPQGPAAALAAPAASPALGAAADGARRLADGVGTGAWRGRDRRARRPTLILFGSLIVALLAASSWSTRHPVPLRDLRQRVARLDRVRLLASAPASAVGSGSVTRRPRSRPATALAPVLEPPTNRAGRKNTARAATASASASTATRDRFGIPARGLDRGDRPRTGAPAPTTGPSTTGATGRARSRSRSRSAAASRVELTVRRRPTARRSRERIPPAPRPAGGPPTSPASSGSGAAARMDVLSGLWVGIGGAPSGGGTMTRSPAARRSAALPARPCPSARRATTSGPDSSSASAPNAAGPEARRAAGPRRRGCPVAGRVAPWRQGRRLRRPRRHGRHRDHRPGHPGRPGRHGCSRSYPGSSWSSIMATGCGTLDGCPDRRRRCSSRRPGRAPPRGGPSPGTSGRRGTRSRGSTPPGGRAPGAPAAPRRSSGDDGPGVDARSSRSSSNATNGQAGAPSTLGSPRSVIAGMIPA